MGYGEVIGNGSVEWRMVHEDNGVPKPLAHSNAAGRPAADRVRIGNANHRNAEGHDPIPLDSVGNGKGHLGHFRVKIRFQKLSDANAAAKWAADNILKEDGMSVLVIDVPVINRPNNKIDPADPPAEIRVDW